MTNEDTQTGESRGVAMNLFAILGFIAILLAGLWATVQLVKQMSRLSFDFSTPKVNLSIFNKDKLAVVPNSTVANSGEAVTLEWLLAKSAQEEDGASITYSYSCQRGLYTKVRDTDGDSYRAIPCNAPYTMPATVTELSIIPILTDSKTGELKYSITYTPAQDSEDEVQVVQGSLLVSAAKLTADSPTKVTVPATKPVATTKSPVKTTMAKPVYKQPVYVAPVRKSDPNGLPDLTVKVLSVGEVDANGNISVKLEVANIGTKAVTGWTLAASLPTEPAYTYASVPQEALYAGERAELLLTFNKLKPGVNQMFITVDALGAIVESLETNNSAITNITL